MYEWIQLMTKDKLSPTSLQTYVISRLNCSQHSSLSEVRSDRIGRTITPRPQSSYYSSPNAWQSRTTPQHSVSLNSTPAHSRPLSVMSDDLDSSLNYSRTSTSPGRDTRSNNAYSPIMMQASIPILHNTPQHRREPVPTPMDRDNHTKVKNRGVFETLYRPDYVNRNTVRLNQTPFKNSFRNSSYNPLLEIDTVTGDLDTIEESPQNELIQFDEAFSEYEEGKQAKISAAGTEKYFDNLVALIEEAAKGLDQ